MAPICSLRWPLWALLCCLTVPGLLHAVPTKLGDIDGDDVFTVIDLARLVGHSTGDLPLSDVLAPFADLNQDTFVNDEDQAELVKLILATSEPQNLPLTVVQSTSPLKNESEVAVTRETVLHFSIPLALNATIDTTKLHADFGGRKILSRVEIASDRKKVTLFYLEPLPSSARMTVTFDSTGINDLLGRALDGDEDGVAGGTFTTVFDTLSITPVASTSISGRVFASERATGGDEVPLAGVTVTVDGAEETLRCETDALGNFTLSPCPSGSFFVHVDGRTSPQSNYPGGAYYPSVGKRWEAIAGSTANLSGNTEDTSRGTIYLPLIGAGSLNAVSQTEDTAVGFSASVLATNPELAGTQLMVPANSLFSDDGTRGGQVGIAPVASDRLPSPLPPGLQLPMVITIQTDGASNFDRPVPISFPNLPDPITGETLPPRAKSALWSFNHDTGRWEIVGPMTVSDDGLFVVCDAGVGVRQPGWHGTQPGTGGNGGGPPPPPPPYPPCRKSAAVFVSSAWDLAKQAYDCAKGLTGVGAGIDCAVKALDGAKRLITGIATFGDLYAKGKGGTVEGAEALVNIIKGERDNLVALLECYKVASPVEKSRAAFNCIGNILSACATVCDALAPPSNAPPSCNPPTIQVTVCRGINVASKLHAYAKTWVDLAYKLETAVAKEVALFVLDNAIAQAQLVLASMKAARPVPIKRKGAAALAPPPPPSPLTEAESADFANALGGVLEAATALQNDLAPFIEIKNGNKEIQRAFSDVILASSDTLYEYGGGAKRTETFYYLLSHAGQDFRGKNTSGGDLNVIMPPEAEYTLSMYSATDKLYGSVDGLSGSNGSQFSLNRPVVNSIAGDPDTDGDGLPNRAEQVLGTDAGNPDSDGDGLTDGVEADQGTNPLDGLVTTTGIIAAVPTSAPALDVCAVNNMAVTANGNNGISIFNALSGLSPTRIADVATPGNAGSVACNGTHVAIGAYQAGLCIVDVSKPGAIQLTHQVPLGSQVQAVAVSGPVAYAGTASGQVVMVDMASGLELQRITLPNQSLIQDLTTWRDMLYVLQSGQLTALNAESLTVTGSLSLSGGLGAGNVRLRVFAGEGTLYAINTSGFSIIDTLTNPGAPALVQEYTNGQFGWRHIVANGSGVALAAVGPNSTPDGAHPVALYTVGADLRTPAFVTNFDVNGAIRAVAIYNGVGYLAAETGGLQVVSYKAYDTLHVAPTISLAANVPLDPGTKTGVSEEGKLMRVSATVSDDVQVRNVEFYVNNELLVIDGNYPFEHRFTTPALAAGSNTFKIKARATDTGGNATWSDEFTLTLVPDATPPQLRAIYPGNNSIFKTLNNVYATFNEPMAPDSFNGSGFQLVEAGFDKTLGTPDDKAITDGQVIYRETSKAAFMEFASAGLTPGFYKLTVTSPIADAAGNLLPTTTSTTFRVYNPAIDTDSDGIPDDWESLLGLNPNSADSDFDTIPDGREDYDFDGLANSFEFVMGSNPLIFDTDGNGIRDGSEDADADGLADSQEFAYNTDPFRVDTDGDGQDDGTEVFEHTDPVVANPRRITIQSQPVALFNLYQPPGLELAATTGRRSVASPVATFINLKADVIPPGTVQRVTSSLVSMLNARQAPRIVDSGLVSFQNTQSMDVLPYTVTSAASPLVSFVNVPAVAPPPATFAYAVATGAVTYLNLPPVQPAPPESLRMTASPVIYFLYSPPAATASAPPLAPPPPSKSLTAN